MSPLSCLSYFPIISYSNGFRSAIAFQFCKTDASKSYTLLNDIRLLPLQSKVSTPIQDLPPPPPMAEGDDDDYYDSGSQQVEI